MTTGSSLTHIMGYLKTLHFCELFGRMQKYHGRWDLFGSIELRWSDQRFDSSIRVNSGKNHGFPFEVGYPQPNENVYTSVATLIEQRKGFVLAFTMNVPGKVLFPADLQKFNHLEGHRLFTSELLSF